MTYLLRVVAPLEFQGISRDPSVVDSGFVLFSLQQTSLRQNFHAEFRIGSQTILSDGDGSGPSNNRGDRREKDRKRELHGGKEDRTAVKVTTVMKSIFLVVAFVVG